MIFDSKMRASLPYKDVVNLSMGEINGFFREMLDLEKQILPQDVRDLLLTSNSMGKNLVAILVDRGSDLLWVNFLKILCQFIERKVLVPEVAMEIILQISGNEIFKEPPKNFLFFHKIESSQASDFFKKMDAFVNPEINTLKIQFVYKWLTITGLRISPELCDQIKHYKEELVNYISKLGVKERFDGLLFALNPAHPLGQLLYTQRGVRAPHLGAGELRRVYEKLLDSSEREIKDLEDGKTLYQLISSPWLPLEFQEKISGLVSKQANLIALTNLKDYIGSRGFAQDNGLLKTCLLKLARPSGRLISLKEADLRINFG